jgi:hypothetical protein
MLSGEATNINYIVFGLTQSGLEHTTGARGEHANHYTTDAVVFFLSYKESSKANLNDILNISYVK